MPSENEDLSKKLIRVIEFEISSKKLDASEDIKNLLCDIMSNYYLKFYINDKFLYVDPRWMELYFLKFDEKDISVGDPYCDKNYLKRFNNTIYIKYLFSKPNRADICLGKENYMVSLLLKRALIAENINESKQLEFKSDVSIAQKLSDFAEVNGSIKCFQYLRYEFVKRDKDNPFKTSSCRRINLSYDNKKPDPNNYLMKEFAVYDSENFEPNAGFKGIVDLRTDGFFLK